jgi:hypothetical protein
MALDAERELTQWTAGIDVKRTLPTAAVDVAFGRIPALRMGAGERQDTDV